MPGTDVNPNGIISRALPVPGQDNTLRVPRVSRYGEQVTQNVMPTKHPLSEEGQYFVATNPTIGTGVAHALVTAFSDTSGLFVIKNNDTAGGKRIYLDFIRLMLTAAPTAGNSLELALKIDPGNRLPTAGNVAVTPANVNADSSNASIANVQAFNAAALTVPASSASARTVGRVKVPTGVNVIGDEYVLQFGGVDYQSSSPPLTAIRAAQPARFVDHCAPIVIGPQQYLVIHRWSLTEATAAPSYEYEIGWWER